MKMAPFEVLYGRKCRTPLYWSQTGESQLFGTDIGGREASSDYKGKLEDHSIQVEKLRRQEEERRSFSRR
jgi:hypothetical protein